jgi:hypothetical protein
MKKGKLKKIIRIAIVTLLVILIMGILIFKLYGNQLLRTAIVTGAQKALQVDVRLDSIDLKVVAGKVDLQNMEIDNPEGYNHPTFLKLGHAYMDLDVASLTSDTISMDMVQLENINLVIEQKGKTNNLKEILNNLPKSETTEPAEEGAGKNVRIKVLEINNIEVKAKLIPIPGQADTVTLRIKPIRMENLGTDEKIDFAGLTAKILKAISKGVAEQGAGVLPTDMIGSIGDELGKQGEALLKGTKDIGKSATGGIGGLFKKKEKEEE